MLAKIIRGSSDRRTRFHTERGTLLPFREWLRIPILVLGRLSQRQPKRPWFALGAVAFLSRVIEPDWRVVECGAGVSTIWFGRLAGSVVSLEHDPQWFREVVFRVREEGLTNVEVRHVPLSEFGRYLSGLPDRTIDLAIVDSSEEPGSERLTFVTALAEKIRVGGYLVLDDSDRPRYRAVDGVLVDWPVRRFVGLKERPLLAVETSVYVRGRRGDE